MLQNLFWSFAMGDTFERWELCIECRSRQTSWAKELGKIGQFYEAYSSHNLGKGF